MFTNNIFLKLFNDVLLIFNITDNIENLYGLTYNDLKNNYDY